ncbi:MAG: radical SAM protein [Planctomycetota bacterium]|nr:radical SAM protein [Planctomycetota bacterium]
MQPQIGKAFGKSSTKPSDGIPGAGAGRITTFAQLLARIHDEIPTLQRLRFVTNFPRDLGDDILRVMASRPRICRYLHLPVQSGSDRVLKLMNRGYEIASYFELLERVRAHLPDVQVASDLICGFPSETEEDHRATCDLLERARFKNCFIFKYSPRPGTAAIDRFEDDVPDEVKRRRNNELLAIQARVSAEVHREMVGKTVRVFVESVSEHGMRSQNLGGSGLPGGNVTLGWEKPVTQLAGRTDGDLIVCFDAPAALVGSIVEVRIERAAPLTLFGRMLAEPAAV